MEALPLEAEEAALLEAAGAEAVGAEAHLPEAQIQEFLAQWLLPSQVQFHRQSQQSPHPLSHLELVEEVVEVAQEVAVVGC